MAVSRCAREYLRRKGLVDDKTGPRSRLDADALRIHDYPLPDGSPSMCQLRQTEGGESPDESPDRGVTLPWPGTYETEIEEDVS